MGNADKAQMARGSQGFMQMRCTEGSLEHSSLALASPWSKDGHPGALVVGCACG